MSLAGSGLRNFRYRFMLRSGRRGRRFRGNFGHVFHRRFGYCRFGTT